MIKSLSLPLFLGGMFLITFGLIIRGATGTADTRLFTGSAADVCLWLFLIGFAAAAVGLRGASRVPKGA